MEAKFLVVLLILGLTSTSLAKGRGKRHDHDHDRHHDDDHHHRRHGDGDKKCPQLDTSGELPMKCTIRDDCNTISCSAEPEGEAVTLSLKFDTSQDSATVSIRVPSRDYDWSRTFKSGEKIHVPGFPLSIKGLADADLYLMFTGNWAIDFKLNLYIQTDISSKAWDVALLEVKMPAHMSGDHESNKHYDPNKHYDHKRWGKCRRFASWFKRQSKPVKASIIISAILVFLLVVCAITYCCKKRRVAKKLEVKPPSYDEATSTETKVPMEPLVNEE